jgi:nucleoside 2-deoxyribosyltransferase
MVEEANAKPARKICFVIAPLGEDGSEERRRSDQVLQKIINPATKKCGYEQDDVVRADQIPNPGIITSQVIQHIVEADLVIADLTGHNPNVFYELAIRHATQKPVVILIQRGQAIPFDVSQNRAIKYDPSDWDSPERCCEEMTKQIRFVSQSPTHADNPISAAVRFQALSQSADPVAKCLTELVARVQNLQAEVAELRRWSPIPAEAIFAGMPAGNLSVVTCAPPVSLGVPSGPSGPSNSATAVSLPRYRP